MILSLNVGASEYNPAKSVGRTGIGKQPVEHAVAVRAPGPKTTGLHSGLIGDFIGDIKHHGGDDQAVYAYAIEDYAWWAAQLGRDLAPGLFGENLTTEGVDVGGAVIGEVWHVGDTLVLQPTFGRIPCATFQHRMGEKRWTRRFAEANRTGAYLRVLVPGEVRAGDRVEVTDRPAHKLTINEAFGIYMHDPARLPRLLEAAELPVGMHAEIEERLARTP
ncbi:MOSC domain-containing protein [Actinoplanes sp. GCM10030250]|uniref:MOSC domain-containing protein n=1 Tax=Actinoplanes sp. GCM10030250 TaxID=3273376 RepID=UPI003605EFA0